MKELNNYKKKISKNLIFNDIPVEQHDKNVDYAICENGITGFATHLLNG